MYKQCQTEQSAARQVLVEQCLLRELGQRHYDDISVTDLCRLAGISRKSFYRYFSGKSGVLHALLDHTIMELDSMLEGNCLPFRQSLLLFFRYWMEHRELLDVLNRSGLLTELTERAVRFTFQHEMDLASTPEPQRAERQYRAEVLIAGLIRVMVSWYRGGFLQPPEQMAVLIAAIFPSLSPGEQSVPLHRI